MKKIITIIAISLVVIVLGITTLVLSLIKVGENNIIELPTQVHITNATTHENERGAYHLNMERNQDKSKIQSLYDALNEGFKQSLLESLFRGGNKGPEAYYEPQAGDLNNMISKNYSTSKRFTVYFYYPQKKSIRVDGRDLLYQYVFFEVTNSDEMALVTFAVNSSEMVDVSTENTSDITDSTGYKFSYKAYVNLKGVYDVISAWNLAD